MEMKGFIKELASNSPAPGGGSVAALCGSLSNALSTMVFNLTVDKKIFHNYEKEIQVLIVDSLKEADVQKDEFLTLMDKDTEAFLQVMNAFKMPKNTEDEKKARSEKIQETYKKAVNVPLEVAEKALKAFDYVSVACKYGNKNSITDAGVAAIAAKASIEGAILNVKINLSSIKDEKYKKEVYNRCEEILKNGEAKKQEMMEIVDSIIEC